MILCQKIIFFPIAEGGAKFFGVFRVKYHDLWYQGRIQGGTPSTRAPKIGKNMIFWHKIVIFHTKYPKKFCASLRNWKKYDFTCIKPTTSYLSVVDQGKLEYSVKISKWNPQSGRYNR
jgi:hypothetical protein